MGGNNGINEKENFCTERKAECEIWIKELMDTQDDKFQDWLNFAEKRWMEFMQANETTILAHLRELKDMVRTTNERDGRDITRLDKENDIIKKRISGIETFLHTFKERKLVEEG